MPRMLDRVVDDAVAWKSETMLPNDGLVAIDQECQAELDAALKVIQDNPMPIIALDPDDFQLPACRQMMGGIKETLDNGIGFAILDALPVDRFEENESKALYWILLSMLGNTVAQKWDGLLLYDVTDTGEKSGPGKGVRGSKTNQGQTYHTDNSYNLPPNYVSLLCLETAKEGGRLPSPSQGTAATRNLEANCRNYRCGRFDLGLSSNRAPLYLDRIFHQYR